MPAPPALASTDEPAVARPAVVRPDYRLKDSLWAPGGAVFLTGTQALVRLLLMQKALDAARGLDTRGFVSGYRGSPLGMVDQAIWKAGLTLDVHGIDFVPGINEELAATQVLGTQRVESDPERTVQGVFGLWYGKGPGVDRAGDAIKHGNAFGASPHGGVLVVAGDDHGCVSSSMPHQSDQAFQAWQMPVVSPSNVAELVEFGLYGWALSRFSGHWVGLTALSEVVESGATVDLDDIARRVAAWQDADAVCAATGYTPPPGGLHYRWPDLPSLELESRLHHKLDAARAFARVNPLDRLVIAAPQPRLALITCGKAHHDVMEVLRRLGLAPDTLAQAGISLYKVGMSFPLDASRIVPLVQDLQEVLVIEEKGAVVETQLRDLLYSLPQRPQILGKRDADGQPLVSALGELRPSRLIVLIADWLQRHCPPGSAAAAAFGDYRQQVRDFLPPELLANAGDAVRRLPYFCAGCPHNTSTVVPEGSQARAGIGCHFMANWMDRDTQGLIQMGGEGVDWVSHARFTRRPHIFQNLGDGTYYHSGYLAIRQAVAAKASITYKILFNDAVAMTGGQPVDGVISVDAIARQVESEGVRRVVVVSDDIGKYASQRHRFPAGTAFHDRSALDAVQRELRDTPGVTVLIYEQTCAAEKRRRRKKGELADPPLRLFIHPQVCEGCGDCTVQSNCVAVLPLDTPLGRKRQIDQSGCNKDYSCAKGFCPSFVGVRNARPRRPVGILAGGTAGQAGQGGALAAFEAQVAALPQPAAWRWSGPYDLLVTGVGGTGVVTVGALVAMAAHLQGLHASVLDFMGFAQKGGSVLSFVRLAQQASALNQVRIDTQQADAVLACDLVVAAAPEALQTVRHGRTRVLVNTHETPVAESLRNPDADLRTPLLLEKLRFAAGDERVQVFDAQALALAFIGDTQVSNVLALGYAWQMGLVPLALAALERAIELNGVAVPANRLAFALGRLAAADPAACERLLQGDAPAATRPAVDDLAALKAQARDLLTAWQDAPWAQRWLARVERVEAAERGWVPQGSPLPLTWAVGRSLMKLMSYKDEYEVARLMADPLFERQLQDAFETENGEPLQRQYHLAPPLLARSKNGQAPRKITLTGRWARALDRLWPVLARGKRWRGSWLDVLGHTAERCMERRLITEFESRVDGLLAGLAGSSRPPTPERLALALQIAQAPMAVRGYGHVKAANVAQVQAREASLLQRWTALAQ